MSEQLAELIDVELAAVPPERMMHVLGRVRPDGSVLLTHGILDDAAETSHVHVRASDRGEALIQRTELDEGVQYLGVVHSHPQEVPEPSGQDRVAASDLLRLNQHMPVAVVGVVVAASTRRRGRHVLRIRHGEVAVHVAGAAASGLQPAVARVIDTTTDFWQGCSARLPAGALSAVHQRHAVVVGAGSVGSVVAEQLVRAGLPRLTLVDPDLVESVNLSRTVYRQDDVGRAKVEALAERLASINPDVQVTPLRMRVEPGTAGELAAALRDADLALGVADDNRALAVLDVLLHETDTPGVFAGVYRAATGGDIVTVVPGLTACYRCTVGPRQEASNLTPGVDYATGRLAGEVALGADVATISLLTARTALGVLGALADTDALLRPTVEQGRNFVQVGLQPGFFSQMGLFDDVAAQHAWQSVWMRGMGDPDCRECGEAVQALPDLDVRLAPAETTEEAVESDVSALVSAVPLAVGNPGVEPSGASAPAESRLTLSRALLERMFWALAGGVAAHRFVAMRERRRHRV
ncbi:ThiF family adenylyltransferase [Geodermatophilus sp. URMC 62]|uniref:ThiF family adenylyltransferase n=1 Tax=Geodermatophilus sp. URMC 62 TaxID=3423414 RepID=UPI00406D3BB0